jgi:outer membrane lipoprotein SlyB
VVKERSCVLRWRGIPGGLDASQGRRPVKRRSKPECAACSGLSAVLRGVHADAQLPRPGVELARSAEAPLGETEIRFGRIDRIDAISLDGDHKLGVGHVLGAIGGGALGHEFGGGKGKVVAQVLGSLGGGYLGGEAQNKYLDRRPGQHITVTLNNGVAVGVTQPQDAGLRVGDCVRIDGAGQSARVVRDHCVGAPVAQQPLAERFGGAGPEGDRMRERLRERFRAAPPAAAAPLASSARPAGETEVRFGRIDSIEAVPVAESGDLGVHHVANGAAGEAFGYRLPGGGGREFADVARSLGSAEANAPASERFAPPRAGQYIVVRLDNGVIVGISQLANDTLRTGDRVRIDGTGQAARVVRV